jgi:hypothetical protein
MYVPHQIHLTPMQASKLMNGGAINLPMHQMGSDKGSEVVLLKAPNAKKLLSGFKRSKGVRLMLSPDEIEATMMKGSGINIGKAFKKLGRDIKKGATKAISDVDRAVIKPVAKGFKKEIIDSGLGKQIARELIDVGTEVILPAGLGGLSMLAGDPTGMSGQIVGSIAGRQLNKLAEKGGYGIMSQADAKKKYMALIRSMRGMAESEKMKIKGSGFFKELKKWTGIGKTKFIAGAKKIGKDVLATGAMLAGEAVTAKTGNPVAGAMVQASIEKAGSKTIDSIRPSKGKLGISFDPKEGVNSLKRDAKMYAVEAVDREIDKLPSEYRGLAQDALAGKYPDAKSLIYDVAQTGTRRAVSEALGATPMGGLGMRRLKKGRGATQSKAFKQALKNNFGGLALTNAVMDNISIMEAEKMGARLNANVAPSSIETPSDYGFMSPYQRMDSPAMNPFIPKTYLQEGGTSSGYAGLSQSELNKLMGAGLYYGRGLY